jgi:calcium-dependent protein kinase
MRKLSHPNIIRVYEIYEDKANFYIVTELCKGGELFEICENRGLLTEKNSAIIIEQLLSAVSYCHALNIVHRDLKPENVLLEDVPG